MCADQVQSGGGVEFERWAEAMQGAFDAFLRETWTAMNAARKGRWIADTEEVMVEARNRLGRCAYEKLLQLRIEAGEKSFFPSRPRPGLEEQGRPGLEEQSRPGLAEQGPQGGNSPDGGGTR